MKKNNRKVIHLVLLSIVVLLSISYFFYKNMYEGFQSPQSSPFFTDAYTITLDKYPERFPKIKATADAAGINLKRWDGIIVSEKDQDTLPVLGIGTSNFKDRAGRLFNMGSIGCFLAHRGLLEHIRDSKSDSVGTLICEDDLNIPSDFYKKLADVQDQIPDDWDYIFLSKMHPHGNKISKNVIKLDKDMTANKNWGFWGFIVKNSSIPDRILPKLEHMIDAVDLQLAKFANEINMYLIDPPIVSLNSNHSGIVDIDTNG